MAVVLDDCHLCGGAKTLNKLVSNVRLIREDKPQEPRRPGEVVKQHVEEARADLKREREYMTREYDQ